VILEDRSNKLIVLGAVQQKDCPGKKGKMFTNNYIEMVSKADEIQKLCKYNKGDYYLVKGTKTVEIYIDGFPFLPEQNVPLNELYVWLPTLEDLFGIWCNLCGATNFAGLCQRITERKSNLVMYPNMKFIKELCLETIMKEFYNKFWNPEKKEWEAID
jgi:predicted nucleic-acid-binding Zn-ribbon protein